MNRLQGVSQISLFLNAGWISRAGHPSWGAQFDPRFYWPGDEFNAGPTGTLIQTTWDFDFAPTQPACIYDEPAPLVGSSTIESCCGMLGKLLKKEL